MTDVLPLDPFAIERRADPHPDYRAMREQAPLFKVTGPSGIDECILTRHDDCTTVLRDPRWSSNPMHLPADNEPESPIRAAVSANGLPVLLFLDPPDHTRLRRLVSKAFTPKTIEQMRGRIHEILDDLLAGPTERGEIEVISELAYPLPVTVICELMGVPVSDRDQFQGWSSDASRLLDGDFDEATGERGLLALMQFLNYFNEIFEERRREPGEDLISQLVAVEEEGDRLTEQELRAIVLLLFVAGHETTMNLIGNGLFHLLDKRDQYERLAADPNLTPRAVEECLRFDGPVHLTGRVATEQLVVHGQTFEAGQQVVALLAAANRDPEVFSEPDRFDIGRTENPHLTFSHGMHFCLGAALARVEGQVVLGELARRFLNLELHTTEPRYRDHFVLRGLEELKVGLG